MVFTDILHGWNCFNCKGGTLEKQAFQCILKFRVANLCIYMNIYSYDMDWLISDLCILPVRTTRSLGIYALASFYDAVNISKLNITRHLCRVHSIYCMGLYLYFALDVFWNRWPWHRWVCAVKAWLQLCRWPGSQPQLLNVAFTGKTSPRVFR